MKVHRVRLIVVGVIPNGFQRGICHPCQLQSARKCLRCQDMKQGILALVDNFEQPPGPSRYPVIAISDLLHLSTTQNTDTHVQSEVLQVSEILRFGWCHCPRVPRWVGEGPLPFERFGKVTKPVRLESTGFYSADFFNSKTCAAK